MADGKMQVRVRIAWWLIPYVRTLGFLCGLFDSEPNWERLSYWIRRGIRVQLEWR
jgi:hypothetical protein